MMTFRLSASIVRLRQRFWPGYYGWNGHSLNGKGMQNSKPDLVVGSWQHQKNRRSQMKAMKILEDLEHCAATFWEPIPERSSFPRDLERYLPLHYQASIKSLPGLTVQRVDEWLSTNGIGSTGPSNSRRLDGCIIAQKGLAILFIDAALSVDERRMIVAHETAHYWIDYEVPRRRMKLRYGDGGLQILDQERPAETVEILMATAVGASIQAFYHYHFKEHKQETEVEQRANTLACLLI
ncbi:MAG TPA: hypothetical protein PLN21_19765, partial [Gemmatales bacterium]|nr:hypothetical protein [Gemmatales bacterium]